MEYWGTLETTNLFLFIIAWVQLYKIMRDSR